VNDGKQARSIAKGRPARRLLTLVFYGSYDVAAASLPLCEPN